MKRIYHLEPEALQNVEEKAFFCGTERSYSQYEISGWIGDIELKIVQPIQRTTIWKQFLDRFGAGICCLREQIPAEEFDDVCRNYFAKGLMVGQRSKDYVVFGRTWRRRACGTAAGRL